MPTPDPFLDEFTDAFGDSTDTTPTSDGGFPPTPPAVLNPRRLGSGVNTAAIYTRGGRQLLLPLGGTSGPATDITELSYTRAKDDAGTGYVIVATDAGMDATQREAIRHVHTWAHELVFFRDSRRVWEGPVRAVTTSRGQVRIDAWDVSGWMTRRRIRRKRKTTTPHPVVDEMRLAMRRALSPDDPNVLVYAKQYHSTSEAQITRDVAVNSGYYLDDVKSMCAQGGNMTVVGRSIVMWPDQYVLGRMPQALDLDAYVTADVTIVESGDDLWTVTTAVNSDGKTAVRHAHNPDVSLTTGVSQFYGLHDRYVDAGDAKKRAAIGAVAHAAQKQTYPAPLLVEVPSGAQLSPNTPLTFDMLVPGVVVPTTTRITGARLAQVMQLGSVTVKADGSGEAVTIDLQNPAADLLDTEAGT